MKEIPSRALKRLLEKAIIDLTDATEGLNYGYIGNFEKWGDDRSLRIWLEGERWENGSQKYIWSHKAETLDLDGFGEAYAAVMEYRKEKFPIKPPPEITPMR